MVLKRIVGFNSMHWSPSREKERKKSEIPSPMTLWKESFSRGMRMDWSLSFICSSNANSSTEKGRRSGREKMSAKVKLSFELHSFFNRYLSLWKWKKGLTSFKFTYIVIIWNCSKMKYLQNVCMCYGQCKNVPYKMVCTWLTDLR